jgi:hypothetical protein
LSDVQLPLPYTATGKADALCTFILEDLWTKVGLKVLLLINSCCANFVSFDEYPYHFDGKLHNRDI